MGKYATLKADIFSILDLAAFKAEGISVYPDNFIAVTPGTEFLRASIIPSEGSLNDNSIGGILMIDIFTAFGDGPSRMFAIADILDVYLSQKSVTTVVGAVTQFLQSSLAIKGRDIDNEALFRTTYTIPFSHFGVQ